MCNVETHVELLKMTNWHFTSSDNNTTLWLMGRAGELHFLWPKELLQKTDLNKLKLVIAHEEGSGWQEGRGMWRHLRSYWSGLITSGYIVRWSKEPDEIPLQWPQQQHGPSATQLYLYLSSISFV